MGQLQRELQAAMVKANAVIAQRDKFLAQWLPYYDPLGAFSDESRRMTVALCTQWIGEDVEFPEAYLMRGFAQAYLSEFDSARGDFDRIIGLAASTQLTNNGRHLVEMAMLGRVLIYTETGDEDRARAEVAKVLESAPKLAPAYIFRGRLNGRFGRRRSALEDFAKAIKLNPDELVAYREAARLLASSATGHDASRAVQLSGQACEMTQWRDWRCLETHALASAANGGYAEAVKWTAKAVELAPDDARDELQRRLQLFRKGILPSNPQPL
jgi:tetratricopeptide (TPR) repeat protein